MGDIPVVYGPPPKDVISLNAEDTDNESDFGPVETLPPNKK